MYKSQKIEKYFLTIEREKVTLYIEKMNRRNADARV